MPRDPIRPKRSRDPFKAAYEVFQEVIGERPRQERPKATAKAKKQGRQGRRATSDSASRP